MIQKIQKIQKAVGLIKRRLLISLLIYIHPKSLKPEWEPCPFDSFDSFDSFESFKRQSKDSKDSKDGRARGGHTKPSKMIVF